MANNLAALDHAGNCNQVVEAAERCREPGPGPHWTGYRTSPWKTEFLNPVMLAFFDHGAAMLQITSGKYQTRRLRALSSKSSTGAFTR